MFVEIRPIEKTKWHGKKDKENFSQPQTVEALFDPETGGYATGLTEEERKELEAKTGFDLSDRFNAEHPHPFWSTKAAWLVLPNRTVVLNTQKPLDHIHAKLAKASKFVANSTKEYEEGKWPHATHVIYDEQEEVSLKATRLQKKQQATVLATKMSSDDKIAMIQILSDKTAKGRSNDFLDVELGDLIENKTDDFLRIASMGKEEVTIRASVLELLSKHILTREGSAIYYMGELIGLDYEAAVSWFKNPDNTRMKVAIMEKVVKA